MPYLMNRLRNMFTSSRDYVSDMLGGADPQYRVHVITGDRRGAGTDSNVYIVLHDIHGQKSDPIACNKVFHNDNERGSTTTVDVKENCGLQGPIVKVDVWRDNFADITFVATITNFLFGQRSKRGSAAWFLDRIEVEEVLTENRKTKESLTNGVNNCQPKDSGVEAPETVHKSSSGDRVWVFPLQRWVAAHKKYCIHMHDCFLPQHDPNFTARREDIMLKREDYKYEQKVEGGPAQIENLPSDEKFSEEYYWTFATEKMNLLTQTKFIEWTTSKWNTLEDLKKVYKQGLGEPECMEVWKEDWWFGLQRLQGVNPNVISLCKEIPENFDVTEDTVKGLLDMSLAEALEKNKIFICDLKIMDNLECKDDRELASPLALFYLNKEDRLLPIAIQLKQKSGHDNPVYTPNDAPNTWLVAKMFYNNAEAQHHQALTHLGYTHLLMEGVVICTNRNLSPSHPLFKLMAPHFLFLLAINTRGLEKLVSVGGWVDNCMTQGVKGIFELMRRGFECWRFDREGQIEKELEARGVLDENVLPYYPYRDDGVPLYNAIKKYVTTVVSHHYDTPEKLSGDWELRWWREELVKPRNQSGVGLQNIPGNSEDGFTDVSQVIDVVTVIIATCSLGHAAANFQQYEQYGFVPNYPGILISNVPKEKKLYTEKDIMTILPDKRMTLDIMVITKLLSSKGTNSLGDFEMQYLYDPVGVQAAEEFQKDLKRLSLDMKRRNIDRQWKFEWLDPEIVPNSISV
ncbi:allene oxide synthase-lipoxygenase protein-like isoform X3 [Panulirus ornatus]|uniref:allene oxide synthase-lipoxygenase protein-like isoform X3 n=1 Tax=Panulirus ornatus TaxID=150431 RepID=UPI003A84D187